MQVIIRRKKSPTSLSSRSPSSSSSYFSFIFVAFSTQKKTFRRFFTKTSKCTFDDNVCKDVQRSTATRRRRSQVTCQRNFQCCVSFVSLEREKRRRNATHSIKWPKSCLMLPIGMIALSLQTHY